MTKTDMSPKAIERRLNDINQIWRLSVTLGNARRTAAPKNSPKPAKKEQQSSQ